MLNDLIGMLLGAVHEYVIDEYIPIVDAVVAPMAVIIVLIFCCAVSIVFVRAVIRAIGSGV